MNNLTAALLLLVSGALIQDLALERRLGASPTLKEATLAGACTALVTTVAAPLSGLIYHRLLVPLNARSLSLIASVLAVAGAARLVGRLMAALRPTLSEMPGGSGTLPAANCAVLAASLTGMGGGLPRATLAGILGGLGFMLAALLLAGVKERLGFSGVSRAMRGLPITLVSAGLIALALMGFGGL